MYKPATSRFMTEKLGLKIEEFTPSSTVEPIEISDVKPIASYTWLDSSEPTIVVPGDPPMWKDAHITKVPQDRGLRYIDQNAARMGRDTSPLEPCFVAVEVMGKQDVLKEHDFVVDRNTLRKLFRWANQSGDMKADDFRIDIDLAGETCLFTRVEEKTTELVTTFHGFGAEYSKAATQWPKGCEKATGHHRIVSMNLGGVSLALRYQLDARVAPHNEDALDDLMKNMASLNTDTKARHEIQTIRGIHVKRSTNEIAPQSSLVEIKTRVSHKEIDWTEAYPQLFLSQTAFLFLAKHTKGRFGHVERYALDGDGLKPHAARAQKTLAKLRDVLEDIQDTVKSHGKGVPLSVLCLDGKLTLHERKAGSGKEISEEVLAWFEQ